MEQVKELLLWCRANGIQVGRLRVGDIELELADLEQAKQLAQEMAAIEQKKPGWTPPEPPKDADDLYHQLARDYTGRVDIPGVDA